MVDIPGTEFLHPDDRSSLKRFVIASAIVAVLAGIGFIGISSETRVNGEVTESTRIDFLKLIVGPALAYLGLGRMRSAKDLTDGTDAAKARVRLIGAIVSVVGVALLAWGIVLML